MPTSKDIWVLVADSAKARIIKAHPKTKELSLVEELGSAAARAKGADIVTDRPGRNSDSGPDQRSAMEPSSDPKDVEKHKFVRELTERLTAGADSHRFASLVLVAPPRTLGELRSLLPERIMSLVRKEVGKDLTQLRLLDLPGALDGQL